MSDDVTRSKTIQDDFGAAGASLSKARSANPGNTARRVIDIEGTVSLDNGAVRFAPPLHQGWGRSGLAYGPYPRRQGLSLAVYLLNGHNTAQIENLPESFLARMDRWLRASEQEGRAERLTAWLRSGRVRRTLRMFRWWWAMRRGRSSLPRLDENLAVGWYPEAAPRNPVHAGNGFVMHATGADNGELWTRAGETSAVAARAVPDIPLGLVVVLRNTGAAYYAASSPASAGLPPYPLVRPVAIDVRGNDAEVYGVVTPSTYGQIGFRIDTRVYSVRVATPAAFTDWCGSALAADPLTGEGDLANSAAERGGSWRTTEQAFLRAPEGLRTERSGYAILTSPDEIGLVHAVITSGLADVTGLVVRAADFNNLIRFTVSDGRCALHEVNDGIETLLAEAQDLDLAADTAMAVQIALNGTELVCTVDGKTLLTVTTTRPVGSGNGVGLYAAASVGGTLFNNFEAHPARLRLPIDLSAPPLNLTTATVPLITERFEGEVRPIEGKSTTCGKATWSRLFGRGNTEITGKNEARVVATRTSPNPGRTAFTVPWPSQHLADLEMEMTIPGSDVGEWHKPRGGFIFQQDPDHHLIVSLWRGDEYPGASVSSFFHIGGFEEIYDAVWTNIGRRAWYGDRVRLRVSFDGMQYLVTLDGEPVLYRQLTDIYPGCQRLHIHRVGIVANWEWGNDTGTLYRDFVARGSG